MAYVESLDTDNDVVDIPVKKKKKKKPEIAARPIPNKKIQDSIVEDDDFEIWDENEDDEIQVPDDIPLELIDPNAGKHPIELIWGIKGDSIQETMGSARMFSMKHGMMAGVPIICKDDECAFIDVCTVNRLYRHKKGRCQMEVAALISRFEHYCKHFEVGLDENILPEEITDLTLIRQLCDLEIQILRADNKIAIDGDFIVTSLIDETKRGTLIYEDKVSPATAFKMELYKQHGKILQLLAATRKDKVNVAIADASTQASVLMQKVKELEAGNIIDVALTEDELVNEDGSINYDIISKFMDTEKEGEE